MQELSRLELYKEYIKEDDNPYRDLLGFNISMLRGIEEDFITEDSISGLPSQMSVESRHTESEILESIQIKEQLVAGVERNIQSFENANNSEYGKNIYYRYQRRMFAFRNEIISMIQDRRYDNIHIFNKYVHFLAKINENIVNEIDDYFVDFPKYDDSAGMTKVFLSHAYVDMLYTKSLFRHMYKMGIYLYVDWMHNDLQPDGIVLKDMLNNEMVTSDQLLFLRTPNSELNIQGKHVIRPWCMWEIGNYYHYNGREKYVLNLYSRDDFRDIHLQGMKLLTGVDGVNKKLAGRKIVH